MSLDIEALFVEHHRPLRGYIAKRMVGADEAVIEDMVSDVFERAVRAAPRYQERGIHPKAWVYQIARNLLADHYRHHSVVAIVRLGDLKPYVDHVGTSDHLERLDAQEVVGDAIAALRRDLRRHSSWNQIAVIHARYWQGGTDAEVGVLLGLTEMATKKARLRGLANLRKMLEAA